MGKVVLRAAAVAAVLSFGTAAPASAQTPTYGGGSVPSSTKARYLKTIGVVLQQRGDRIALRFDTTLKCDDDAYDVRGRKTVPLRDGRFRARGATRLSIGTKGSGNRVIYAWRLAGRADGSGAVGTVRVIGVRITDGRREACNTERRRFTARVPAPQPAGAPTPPARARFGGLSSVVVAGLPTPVSLAVDRTGKRVTSRWLAAATCPGSYREYLANITPPMRIGSDGSFSRSERFSVSFADAFVRYRVTFAGRFSGEGATGTFRMRARRFGPKGKRLIARCDTGDQPWSAALIKPVAR